MPAAVAWASLEELDEAKLDETLTLNLSASIWLAQAAIPRYARQWFWTRSRDVFGVRARRDGRRRALLGGKAGVNAFIRGAAFELARDGITVNGVEAGFIEKPGRGTMKRAGEQGEARTLHSDGADGQCRRHRLRDALSRLR